MLRLALVFLLALLGTRALAASLGAVPAAPDTALQLLIGPPSSRFT